MTDYLVKYIAYIDERKRPENFPYQVSFNWIHKVETTDELRDQVNAMSVHVMEQGFFVSPIDPFEIIETRGPVFDKRMIVPLHMITHIVTQTKLISSPVPQIADDQPSLSDGSEQKVQ